MTYNNTNSGALFINEDKKGDRHPDFKGPINIDGKDYFVSGWNNTASSGKKYISLKVTPKREVGTRKDESYNDYAGTSAPVADARDSARATETGKQFDDYDDNDVPF